MIELKPEDMIVQHMHNKESGGMCFGSNNGVSVYYKPRDITVTFDQYKSQHKNKEVCLTVLRDLLLEFKVGDVVYSQGKVAIITSVGLGCGCDVEYTDGVIGFAFFEHIAHTQEGYIYKTTERKLAMIADYQEDIRELENDIKNLRLI